MIADESLVTLNGLKKYDQKKGTAVIEAQELPASPLNKVYNIDDDVYSKDIRLATYQQMLDEVDKVKVDGNTQDANRNIISKAVIEQANVPLTPLDKVYNISNAASVRVFSKSTELATKEYADKFIPLTQKAAANGVATLDANGHVPVEQMPTQSLIFKGYWDASTGAFPAAGTVSGDFYIVSVEGTISGVIYRPGDWIIWDGSAWTLSRNTNAVASVNGQTGAVNLNGSNLQATYEGTTDTINNLLTQVGKVKTVNSQTPDANGNIQVDGSNINATYEGTTDTINNLLTQVGKVKTVNSQSPDANGNIQVDGSNINATYEGTTDTINTLLTQVGKVKTVNSQTPDANGNILLDGSNINATYEGTTASINTLLNQVGKVKTVNNQSPDANGNIQIDLSTNVALNNQLASYDWASVAGFSGRNLVDVLGVSSVSAAAQALKAKSDAKDYSGLRLGDYLEFAVTYGEYGSITAKYEIAAMGQYHCFYNGSSEEWDLGSITFVASKILFSMKTGKRQYFTGPINTFLTGTIAPAIEGVLGVTLKRPVLVQYYNSNAYKSPSWALDEGNDANPKVYLPSSREFAGEAGWACAYGDNSHQFPLFVNVPGKIPAKNQSDSFALEWTRSPSVNPGYFCIVNAYGDSNGNSSISSAGGVRPAFNL